MLFLKIYKKSQRKRKWDFQSKLMILALSYYEKISCFQNEKKIENFFFNLAVFYLQFVLDFFA